jgi:type VI secretion system protein ImpH
VSGKNWKDFPSVIEQLHQEFYRFDFFQAMRILERHFRLEGEKGYVIGRLVRFRNSLNLAFPPSQIENLVYLPDQAKKDEHSTHLYEITPAFFGLTGPAGVLPRFYTEKLIDREVLYRDYAARAFLDIFTNRMLTFFYQAWKKYRMRILYEQDPKRYFLPHILSFVGSRPFQKRADSSSPHPPRLPPEVMAFYSGILRNGPVSALTLERILTQYFRVPIKVIQLMGHRFKIPSDYQASLGGLGETSLGVNSYCGSRLWSVQKKLRLSVGPLSRAQWNDFLPTGSAGLAISQFLAATTGRGFKYELQLILKKEEISGMQLSNSNPRSAHLGWDSFLVSKPVTEDRGDACFGIKPTRFFS